MSNHTLADLSGSVRQHPIDAPSCGSPVRADITVAAEMDASLDSTSDVTLLLPRTGDIVDASAKNTNHLLKPLAQLIGSNIRQIGFAPEQAQRVCAHLERALNDISLEPCEYELAVPSGAYSWGAQLRASSANHVLALVRDVTAQRAMIARLLESKDRFAKACQAKPCPWRSRRRTTFCWT